MPKHRFILLPEEQGDYSNYMQFADSRAGVELDDAIVLHIWDTLKWIDTINPASSVRAAGCGLNYYGVTVINRLGAAKASRIFRLWAELLNEGPNRLELTGTYELTQGDAPASGHYSTIICDRSEIVTQLRSIAQYADRAASESFYLLHLGI
jgi:hypothetical protein